jgi:serine/threonine-protein kinase
MTDALPTQIGKYKIVELVGEGAMGTVYRAVDSVIGRTVAIKVMNASIARQADHRQRFLREAQAAGSLQHPNVVTIFDMGEVDGHLFIAMEFLHGADLEKLMGGAEPLKLQSKLDVIVDVLMGLSYAHKNGIIHRDIKPGNIRVSEDGNAKIMDFGVAHLASSEMTRTGLVVGTPSYMAPEQVTGGKAVPGTDLFAVGAVLYHLLTGSKPFDGPTLQSLFYRIVTDMPRPLEEMKPGLPAGLEKIVQKAMAKDPADRYQTALDMANDIIAVRAGLSGDAYASSVSLTASAVSVVENYAPKPVPVTPPAPKTGTRNLAIGGGFAAVLVIGWLLFGRDREPRNPEVSTTAASDSAPSIVAVAPETAKESVAAPVATTEIPPATVAHKTPSAAPAKKKVEPKPRAVAKASPPKREPTPSTMATRAAISPAVVIPPAPRPTPPRDTVIRTVTVPPPAPLREKAAEVPPAPKPAPRDEVASAVAAYARAIESRNISEVRRAYPGITADQARGFEQFFQASRDINVTFRVADLETNGNSAEARLVGTYEYVTSAGKTEKQSVSFNASLRYDGSSWRLISVR